MRQTAAEFRNLKFEGLLEVQSLADELATIEGVLPIFPDAIAICYSYKYSWRSATMTITPDKEPTLTDVLRKLDELSDEVKKFDERFSNYQQATQWMIQLAFGLIASATVIVIVSNVVTSPVA